MTASTLDRLHRAALHLAVTVDTQDRIRTDPTYSADRTPAAETHRARILAGNLAEFRSAWEAHQASGVA